MLPVGRMLAPPEDTPKSPLFESVHVSATSFTIAHRSSLYLTFVSTSNVGYFLIGRYYTTTRWKDSVHSAPADQDTATVVYLVYSKSWCVHTV